jgi:hypothetical protein
MGANRWYATVGAVQGSSNRGLIKLHEDEP